MTVRAERFVLAFAAVVSMGLVFLAQDIRIRVRGVPEHAVGEHTIAVLIDPPTVQIEEVSVYLDSELLCRPTPPKYECDRIDFGDGSRTRDLEIGAKRAGGGWTLEKISLPSVGPVAIARSVQLGVRALTASGDAVPGLTGADFEVREDGAVQTGLTCQSQALAVDLVLAVDGSENMVREMPAVREQIRSFLAQLGATDRVTMVSYDEKPHTLCLRTSDPAALTSAVDALRAGGPAALWNALIHGIDLLPVSSDRARALIVFTAMERNDHSTVSEANVREKLETSHASLLYAIVRGHRVPDSIQRLARDAGGSAVAVERSTALASALAGIVSDLRHAYMCSFQSFIPADGRMHRLSVSVRSRPGIEVFTKARYRAK